MCLASSRHTRHAHTLELHAHQCTHTHTVAGKDSKLVGKGILLLGGLPDEKKEEKERLQTSIPCVPHPSPSQWGWYQYAPELSTHWLPRLLALSKQLAW